MTNHIPHPFPLDYSLVHKESFDAILNEQIVFTGNGGIQFLWFDGKDDQGQCPQESPTSGVSFPHD